MQASNGQLLVVFDQDISTSQDQDEVLAPLNNVTFGYYPGLGENVRLQLVPVRPGMWTVTPLDRVDQKIGTIRIVSSGGSVDPHSVSYDAEVAHNNLSDLYVKIVTVPETWRPADAEEPVRYRARYGVRQNGNIVWDDTAIAFNSSIDGNLSRGPFYLSHSDWPDIYVVTIAAGHWGVSVQPVIHKFSSTAQALRLNP